MSVPTDPSTLDRAFVGRAVEIRAHGVSWWTRDLRAQEVLEHDPNLLERIEQRALEGELIGTKDIHFVGWRPVRDALHDILINDLFGTKPSPVTTPVVMFLLGLPGSGKSTTLRRIADGYLAANGGGGAVVRDADEVRARLPEYEDGFGSEVVQDEVADLTYGRGTDALPDNAHLIVDVVGDRRWLPREVEHFADRGCSVIMLCSEVPLSVAEQRAKQRTLESGRYVSMKYLRSCDGRPRAALEAALATSRVRHWAVVDTEAPEPRVVDGDGHFGGVGDIARYWS